MRLVRLRADARQRARAKAKAVVKLSFSSRWRRSECEPARKQRPARAGTAPREGKALEGSSQETRAVCNKTAKRRVAKTVERGKNPEDGTGEGLATFVLPDGLTAAWARRGTRRSGVSRGARTPGETDPWSRNDSPRASGLDRRRESGRIRRGRALKTSRTPREDLTGPWFRKSGTPRKTPRPTNGVGGAPEANTALLSEQQNLCRGR